MGMDDIPKRWPLVAVPSNRGAPHIGNLAVSKDAQLVNGFLEKFEEGHHVYKRPGVAVYSSSPAGIGLGITNWLGNIYSIVGDAGGTFATLYENGGSVGTYTYPAGQVTFNFILGTIPKLVFSDLSSVYTYDSVGGLVDDKTALPFTGILAWGSAYLDGIFYVGEVFTNAIYGSGVNNVHTAWNPVDVIEAQIEPDTIIAIAKHLIYVIVLKQWTTEVFFDAGNAVGSSLGPVLGAKMNKGCQSAISLQEIDGELFWVAATRSGGSSIVHMNNLVLTTISTPSIERLILNADPTSMLSWYFKGPGHTFYILTCRNLNITLAYDIREKVWYRWTDTNGNYLPYCGSVFAGTTTLVQHLTNGSNYVMSMNYTNDAGSPIVFELYTPNFDAGIDRRKTLNILRFNADQTPGSVLQVRCNDNDYSPGKWTNFRRVDLNAQRPFLDKCGTFYRRAYHLRHACDTPLRLMSMDMQLDIGTL